MLSVLTLGAWADDVTAVVDNISSYSGTASYVYNNADGKVYARNNAGKYERYGVYEKVSLTHNEVDYIATDASHQTYINTGYIHKANTRIVADVEMTDDGDGWQAVFGARQGSFSSKAFVMFSTANHNGNHNGVFNRSGVETDFSANIPANTRIIIDASGQTATVKNQSNGSTIATATTTGTADAGSNAMFIFNTNTAGAGGVQPDGSYNKMKLYSFRIYEGSTLVKDYVPVVTSEGKGGLKDKLTGDILTSAVSNVDFVHDAYVPVTTYNGKIVYNKDDGYAYQYVGTSFVKKNAVTLTAIDNNDYKSLKNWRCPDDHWSSVFGSGDKINYNETAGTNSINPYEGNGGWEPLHYSITVEANADYNVSFKYSTGSWTTWNKSHSETPDPLSLPFKIIDRESYNQNNGKYTDAGLIAYAKLTCGMADKQDISVDFTSTTTTARFIIQFGVVDDGSHTPAYWFGFDNWEVKKYVYSDSYPDLEVAIKSIAWAKDKGIDTSIAETLLAQAIVENSGSPKDIVVLALKQTQAEKSSQPTIFTMVSESVVGTDDNVRGTVVTNHADGFYVYNVGTGRWFCGGDSYGAHAAVGFPGIKITTPEDNYGSGQYNGVKTWLFNGDWNNGGRLDHDGYCDHSYNAWKFWKQDASQGIYTWSRNGDNTGNNSGNGYGTKNLVGFAPSTYARVNTDRTDASDPYNQWIFVTEAQRDQMAAAAMATASESNPVDLTYKIKMPGFNQRERKEGTNQSSEELDWTCNRANYCYNASDNGSRKIIMGRNDNHADFVCDVYGYTWHEFGNGDDSFSWTQTVTGLTPGKYRVKVQGYNNGGETANKACLVANGQKVALVERSSESVLPWTSGLPGNTFDNPEYFQVGCYWNEVICTVGSNGELTLGVESPCITGSHVVIFDNFRLEYVGTASESVSVTNAGYATYCSENALDFTSTSYIKAYVGTKNGDKLTFTPITQVPANTGLLLVYEGGKTEDVPIIASASAVEGNCLVGVNEQTTINSNDYILNVVNGGAGFYKAGSFTTLGAHKAYIPAAVGGSVKGFTIDFEDDATAIEMVNGQSSMVNGSIYNLAGQRLSKTQKGINIVNGKKILK